MNISVKRTKEKIRSCNNCFAQNYDSKSILNKKVDTLYDVQIGSMLSCLCADCVNKLIESAKSAITYEKEEA